MSPQNKERQETGAWEREGSLDHCGEVHGLMGGNLQAKPLAARGGPKVRGPYPALGVQGPHISPCPARGGAYQADEVGAPGVTQQVGQHNLEGLCGGAPRGDDYILGREGSSGGQKVKGQDKAKSARSTGPPRLDSTARAKGHHSEQASLPVPSPCSYLAGGRLWSYRLLTSRMSATMAQFMDSRVSPIKMKV